MGTFGDIEEVKSVEQLLSENPNLVLKENGKVKCLLTGHEMPHREEAIRQYLSGKKYKRIMPSNKFNYSDFEPMIVSSTKKGHEKQLFCTLTLRHINRTPPHVLRHVSGKKYLKAKARWDECQKNGTKFVPTPLLHKPFKDKDNDDMSDNDSEELNEEKNSDGDDMSDLYPVKYFEDLSLEENGNGAQETTNSPNKNKKRKRSKPVTKPMKSSKPAAKKKKGNLIIST